MCLQPRLPSLVRVRVRERDDEVVVENGDLLWQSEYAENGDSSPLLLHGPVRSLRRGKFDWLPPGGAWLRGAGFHLESFVAEDIIEALNDDEGFGGEKLTNWMDTRCVWLRDARMVSGGIVETDAMARIYRPDASPLVLMTDGSLNGDL